MKYVIASIAISLPWWSCFGLAIAEVGSGPLVDYDEETIRLLNKSSQSMETFVEEPLAGQHTPKYLRETDFQQGMRCGPNALYICLRIMGREVEYEDVLAHVPISSKGASVAQLVSAAKAFGIELEPRKNVSPEALGQMVPPVIVHMDSHRAGNSADRDALDHYTVFGGYDQEKGYFYQVDPTGCTFLRHTEEFIARSFSGYCIAIAGNTPLPVSRLRRTVVVSTVFGGLAIWWILIEFEHFWNRRKMFISNWTFAFSNFKINLVCSSASTC